MKQTELFAPRAVVIYSQPMVTKRTKKRKRRVSDECPYCQNRHSEMLPCSESKCGHGSVVDYCHYCKGDE